MAHKKGGGSSTNGRDSNAQRLGVKAFAGELITGGSIIIRPARHADQAGLNVGIGSDDTLFAKVTAGEVCRPGQPRAVCFNRAGCRRIIRRTDLIERATAIAVALFLFAPVPDEWARIGCKKGRTHWVRPFLLSIFFDRAETRLDFGFFFPKTAGQHFSTTRSTSVRKKAVGRLVHGNSAFRCGPGAEAISFQR